MSTEIAIPGPRPLAQRVAAYGCTDIIRLDEKLTSPEQLDYLDLLPTRANETPKLAAVAACQGTALLYLVDATGDSRSQPTSLAEVSHQLANRSDPAWLGAVRLGSIEIFPIGFHEAKKLQAVKIIGESDPEAPFFFQSLVHGTFEENSRLNGTDYVYQKIFDLLMKTTEAFVPKNGKGEIEALDVLSMAGRALFLRFLIDRRIVLSEELYGVHLKCALTPSGISRVRRFALAGRAQNYWSRYYMVLTAFVRPHRGSKTPFRRQKKLLALLPGLMRRLTAISSHLLTNLSRSTNFLRENRNTFDSTGKSKI
jgi:hypothetical protein